MLCRQSRAIGKKIIEKTVIYVISIHIEMYVLDNDNNSSNSHIYICVYIYIFPLNIYYIL